MDVCPSMSRKLSSALAKRTTMWIYCTVWTLLLVMSSCEEFSQRFEIDEEIPIGTVIGKVGDGIPKVLTPFQTFVFPNDEERKTDWDINPDTGEIKVNGRIDREKNNGNQYQFYAISSTGDTVNAKIIVNDINDNTPKFPSDFIAEDLSESAPVDVKIPLGSATDRDLGLNTTQGYAIVSGNTNNDFNLSTKKAENGVLYVELETASTLDFEKTSFYSLLIEAYDGGSPPKKGYLRVNITIIDSNDNQPIFNQSRYMAEIQESAVVGKSVLQVYATDQDSGENGNIQYHINRQKSDQEEHFRIDPKQGVIYVNKKLDYEKKFSYELIIEAKDNGTEGQKLQTTAVVSVKVLNVNDNHPEIRITFLEGYANGQISEKAQANDKVAQIFVSDNDTETTANINVTLTGGDGYFGLIENENKVYLVIKSRPLDHESRKYFNLNITAIDSGIPPLSSSKFVILYISDANDNSPIFDKNTYHSSILEVVPPGSSVIQVSAQDRDEGNNSVISYKISPSPETHSDWFAIDNRTGLVTTKMRVDCETASVASFSVIATDSGSPPRSSSVMVIVNIENVNDNQPQFEQSFYNVTVSEMENPGFCFLTVSKTEYVIIISVFNCPSFFS